MIRTPISDLGCEQAPPGCEVEKTDEIASVSSGSAGGKLKLIKTLKSLKRRNI